MKSPCVPVVLEHHRYDVVVGRDLIRKAGALTARVLSPRRAAIVSDSNVAPLYAEALAGSLREADFDPVLIVVPAGEASKSMARTEEVCREMIRAGLDRHSCVFALGGGVVGDLAGFAASIFYRGVPVVQLPTTVVSAVDSAVGGKTGVNTPEGKNLIGTFHQPSLVLMDTNSLNTLPDREFREGFAEVIKHAAIRDGAMLELIDEIPISRDRLPELVAANVKIKADIVGADEKETRGLRAFLNFGHTIGHAVESAAGYGALLHGEAISIGLRAALDLSARHAGLSEADAERILRRLLAFHLPLTLPEGLNTDDVMGAMATDKKFRAGAPRFVLLEGLGRPVLSDQISLADARAAVDRLR